jgi:hypothetical protein
MTPLSMSCCGIAKSAEKKVPGLTVSQSRMLLEIGLPWHLVDGRGPCTHRLGATAESHGVSIARKTTCDRELKKVTL